MYSFVSVNTDENNGTTWTIHPFDKRFEFSETEDGKGLVLQLDTEDFLYLIRRVTSDMLLEFSNQLSLNDAQPFTQLGR